MTIYTLHGLSVSDQTLDPETKRYTNHEPQVSLGIIVGKRDKIEQIPLDRTALIRLNHQVARALARLDGIELM